MDEKNENKNKKKSQKKKVLILIILLLIFLIPTMIFWVLNIQKKDNLGMNNFNEEKDVIDVKEKDGSKNEGMPRIEQGSSVDEEIDKEQMVSENYRVSQVKFSGNAVIEDGKTRNTKLEIYQVKSENIISQEDNEPRIFISWKTNKEAISSVSYAKSDGKNLANVVEEGYGFEHTMLLKNMEFSTIYTYKIEAKDKWGNKVNTEYFSAYTGDKSESIFDLITNAIEDVFGWAM